MSDNENAQWGIVELMGHKVVAGRISKSEEFGTVLLRVDVPATGTYPEFTQMYGNSAIYCVTFTSEDVARIAAERAKVNPVSIYAPELVTQDDMKQIHQHYQEQIARLQRQLPTGTVAGDEWTDDQDDAEDEDEQDEE
jgi:hypothetical protein